MKLLAIYRGHTEAEEGVSKTTGNPWRKMNAIFETVEERPKQVAFVVMNSTCDRVAALVPGTRYEVNFDLNSREYNGKWYTDAKAWGIYEIETQQQQPVQQQSIQQQQVATQSSLFINSSGSSDDLPF